MSEDKETEFAAAAKVRPVGYVMLLVAFVFFSGILAEQKGWISALDYTTLNGSFGSIKGKALTFVGAGGQGARAGFLFALSLIPGRHARARFCGSRRPPGRAEGGPAAVDPSTAADAGHSWHYRAGADLQHAKHRRGRGYDKGLI